MEDTDPYIPAYDRKRLIQLLQTPDRHYSSTEDRLQNALRSPKVQRDLKNGRLVHIILATSKIPILG